eukprot:15436099-Alexandrium_andersonii.AAC.1
MGCEGVPGSRAWRGEICSPPRPETQTRLGGVMVGEHAALASGHHSLARAGVCTWWLKMPEST